MTTFATTSNSAARRDITVLGAGHIGFAMALLLQQYGDYDILVADRDPARLAEVAALGISTRLTVDDASLQAAIDGRFAVLNALPFHRAVPVATLCASAGVHYFDLTEDVASTQAIRALAANARSVLMPQCGLAPGFIGIVGNDLARRFDTLHTLRIAVWPTAAMAHLLPCGLGDARVAQLTLLKEAPLLHTLARLFFLRMVPPRGGGVRKKGV